MHRLARVCTFFKLKLEKNLVFKTQKKYIYIMRLQIIYATGDLNWLKNILFLYI